MIVRLLTLLLLTVTFAAGPRGVLAQQEEVLAVDEPTSTTWTATRHRLATHSAGLLELARANRDHEAFEETVNNLTGDLRDMEDLSARMTPNQAAEISGLVDRADKLLELLAADYLEGTPRELQTSLRLLQDTLAAIERAAAEGDRESGRAVSEVSRYLPPDWGNLRFGNESTRRAASTMPAADLLRTMDESRRVLADRSTHELPPWAEEEARRLGEMARALVYRQGEMPELMRPGFRNAALRAEVISENLVEFTREKRQAHFVRQLEAFGEALDSLNGYLEMRDRVAARESAAP